MVTRHGEIGARELVHAHAKLQYASGTNIIRAIVETEAEADRDGLPPEVRP